MYSAWRTTADMDLHGTEGTQQAPKGRYILDAVSFVIHVYRRHYALTRVCPADEALCPESLQQSLSW